MNYHSGTATTAPFAAGSPPPLPLNDAEQLGRLLQATTAELQSLPQTPQTQSRYGYLLNQAAQLQQRLAVVWDNPPAWEGVHRQMLELRQGVQSLRAAPFRTGDTRQGIPSPAPTLQGGLGNTMAMGHISTGALVVSLLALGGVVWVLRSQFTGGGTSLGNPHGLKLNLKNPKFPTARKAK